MNMLVHNACYISNPDLYHTLLPFTGFVGPGLLHATCTGACRAQG